MHLVVLLGSLFLIPICLLHVKLILIHLVFQHFQKRMLMGHLAFSNLMHSAIVLKQINKA